MFKNEIALKRKIVLFLKDFVLEKRKKLWFFGKDCSSEADLQEIYDWIEQYNVDKKIPNRPITKPIATQLDDLDIIDNPDITPQPRLEQSQIQDDTQENTPTPEPKIVTESEIKENMNKLTSDVEDAQIESETNGTSSSQFEIPKSFNFNANPLADEPEQRSYNESSAQPNGQDIPEPTFSKIVDDAPLETGVPTPSLTQSPSTSEPKPEPKPINKGLEDATEKEKEIAAEQLTDIILDGYEKLHTFVKPYAKINEKKVMKLIATNQIDPKMSIQTVDNENLTTLDFINATNESVDEILTHDKAFNAKIRPAMVRELKKKGGGLTDMQFILLTFGQDLGMKAALVLGLKKQMNSTLDLFKQMNAENQTATGGAQPLNPDQIIQDDPPPRRHEQTQQEPISESEEVYDDDNNRPEVE